MEDTDLESIEDPQKFLEGNLNLESTAEFLDSLLVVTPFRIRRIQTDNGSEFEKHFRHAIHQQHVIHFHTYPMLIMNTLTETFRNNSSIGIWVMSKTFRSSINDGVPSLV